MDDVDQEPKTMALGPEAMTRPLPPDARPPAPEEAAAPTRPKPAEPSAASFLILFFGPIKDYLEDDDVSATSLCSPSLQSPH